MTKSDKPTIMRRTNEIVRLLLAGAEYTEIVQYAQSAGWDLSGRQVRRYIDYAYRQLARLASRDRAQLLGRHLMQRRALYARAIKNNDLRTALQILRDEAALEGLYPPYRIAPVSAEPRRVPVEIVAQSRPQAIEGGRADEVFVVDSSADAEQLR